MNIYDTKPIKCSVCSKSIGEVEHGSSIMTPICGSCNKKERQAAKKEIKKILVPVDRTKKSTRALDTAIYLSKHLGSSVTVMQVIPTITMNSTSFFKDMLKELSQDAEESIKWAKNYCQKKNIVAKHKIMKGDEAEGILKTARMFNFDLIILGSSGKGAFNELLFGSISNYVTHNSSIPVLTVKEGSEKLGAKNKQNKKLKKTHKDISGRKNQRLSKGSDSSIPDNAKKLLVDHGIIVKELKKSRGLDEGMLLQQLEEIGKKFKQITGKNIDSFIKSSKK